MTSMNSSDREKVSRLIFGHFIYFHFFIFAMVIITALFIPAVLETYSLIAEKTSSMLATNIIKLYYSSFTNLQIIPYIFSFMFVLDFFYFGLFTLLLFKAKYAWYILEHLHFGLWQGSAWKVIYHPTTIRYLGLKNKEYLQDIYKIKS